MAYKLEIPSSSRVHPIFHVSFLKKVIGDKIPIQTIFVEIDEEAKFILEHGQIIEKRTKQMRNRAITDYLIEWKNLPIEDSTQGDESFIHKHP